jgi:cell division protein FtsL
VAKRAIKKTKKVGSGFLTKFLLLVLAGTLGWQLYGLRTKMKSAKAQQVQLTQQIEAKQQENEALKDSISKGGSKDEIEKIARDKLGLASPGEKVFYDTSN